MDLNKVKKISNFSKGSLIKVDNKALVQTGEKFESGHPVWKVIKKKSKSDFFPSNKSIPTLNPKKRPVESKEEFENYKLKLQKEEWEAYQKRTKETKLTSLLKK